MTKNEENKLSMYGGVSTLLEENQQIIDQVPALQAVQTRLDTGIEDIKARNEEHQTVAEGAADKKDNLKFDMIDEVKAVSGPLSSYAAVAEDEELLAIVNISKSVLRRLRDTQALARARTIYDRAETLLPELADYLIDETDLGELKASMDAYDSALGNRETVSGVKTAARQALSDAFDTVDHILYNILDPLMELFHKKNRDFYNQYHSNRVIKDLR